MRDARLSLKSSRMTLRESTERWVNEGGHLAPDAVIRREMAEAGQTAGSAATEVQRRVVDRREASEGQGGEHEPEVP